MPALIISIFISSTEICRYTIVIILKLYYDIHYINSFCNTKNSFDRSKLKPKEPKSIFKIKIYVTKVLKILRLQSLFYVVLTGLETASD